MFKNVNIKIIYTELCKSTLSHPFIGILEIFWCPLGMGGFVERWPKIVIQHSNGALGGMNNYVYK